MSRLRGLVASAGVFAVAGSVVSPVVAPSSGQPAAGSDDSARAVRLLRSAVLAHANVAYRGTRLVTAWEASETTTVVLDVRHLPGQGTTFRLRGAGERPSSVTFVAQRELGNKAVPTLEGGPLRLLIRNYSLAVTGHDYVAGRRVSVVTATHDGVATGRFWIDRSTGLMVRREVYDANGALVRASAFVDLRIEQPSLLVRPAVTMPQPQPVAMSLAALSRLTRRGWDCPARLPGGFRVTDVQRVSTEPTTVQSSYSDGLSSVSVFEQHGSLDPAAVQGYRQVSMDGLLVYIRYGMPTSLTWANDGSVYTALTDAPATYLPSLVAAYPRAATAGIGFWDRLRRGSGRLLGWVAPAAARI